MCKFRAFQIIREELKNNNCRFITSQLNDGVYTIWYINGKGDRKKLITTYRFYTEEKLVNKIKREMGIHEQTNMVNI